MPQKSARASDTATPAPSQAWLEQLTHFASEGLLAIDTAGQVCFANAAAHALLHQPQLVGCSIYDVMAGLQVDSHNLCEASHLITQVLHGTEQAEVRMGRRDSNGTRQPLCLRAQVCPDGAFLSLRLLPPDPYPDDMLSSMQQQIAALTGMLERSPAVIFLWRVAPEWPTEYVTANIRQFGYEPEELLSGRVKLADLTYLEDIPRLEAEVAEFTRQGLSSFQQEYRIVTKDGAVRWVVDRTIAIRDANGALTHYQGVLLDITERKLAEQAMRESEAKYRLLVETIPALTYTTALDASDTTVFVSSHVEQLLGVTREEYQANPHIWRELLHPGDYDRVVAAYSRSLTRGEPYEQEFRMFGRDGRLHWFIEQGQVVRDADGTPRFLHGVMLDITQRKAAEDTVRKHNADLEKHVQKRTTELAQANRRLEEQRAILHSIIDAVDAAVLLVEVDGRIVLANAVTAVMAGVSEEELVGMDVYAYCPTELIEDRRSRFEQVLTTGLPVHFTDTLDGRILETRLYPVHGADGQVSRVVILGREIAE